MVSILRAVLLGTFGIALALALANPAPIACAASDNDDLPADYQQLSAEDKLTLLWTRITSDRKSETWPSTLSIFKMLFWDMRKVFSDPTDLRPYAPRVAHVVGAYVKARYVPNDSANALAYTGMYVSGAPAILRMSTATEPSPAGDGSIVPAVAVKMLRDGSPSANFAAMYTFDGTPGHNFFDFPVCTHGPRKGGNIGLQVLAWAFDKISTVGATCGGTMRVANASVDGTPVPVDKVNLPYAVILQPNPALKAALDGYVGSEIMKAIYERVNDTMIGQVGYRVLAVTGPNIPGDDKLVHVGDFVIESEMTTSGWGDRRLFFQQQLFDEELALRVDWKEKTTTEFLLEEGLPYKYINYMPPW
eukprot:Opistho-2@40986